MFLPEIKFRACWSVYSESQTVPRKMGDDNCDRKNTEEGSKTHTTTIHPPLTTSSYDVEGVMKTAPKPPHAKDLRKAKDETRLITTSPKTKTTSKAVKVYCPEGFCFEGYPALTPFKSTVVWIFHKIHENRFVNSEGAVYGRTDYIRINSKFARNICPNFSTVVQVLIDLGIIERDFYQPGSKSYGYRFSDPQLRDATRRRVPLNDPKMVARINRHRQKEISTRTDRWLKGMLFQLALADVDQGFLDNIAGLSYRESGGSVKDKLEAYGYWLERIAHGEHVWRRDDQGRRYSIITNMKRELRSLLRIEGQRLQQIDISNSQWLFLALEMRRDGIDCPEYLEACEQGLLYETVAERTKSLRRKMQAPEGMKVARNKVKKELTQRALFSPNDAPCQKRRIKRTFDQLFPQVADYVHEAKRHGDGSRLARTLQAAEAELIIGQVCGRLRREARVRFITPVHDSLLFLPEDGEYVKSVMEEEFAKLRITPKLKIKEVGS